MLLLLHRDPQAEEKVSGGFSLVRIAGNLEPKESQPPGSAGNEGFQQQVLEN